MWVVAINIVQQTTLPELSIIIRFENISSLCQSHTFGKAVLSISGNGGSCMFYLGTKSSFSVHLSRKGCFEFC